jgi:hypothetical protein
VDWGDILKTLLTGGALLATGTLISINGYKLHIGRAAKQADLFDRLTKEIAVRDSLLKLKLSASKRDSPQEISAMELTYKRAEELEEKLNKELTEITARTPPEQSWWRQSSYREKLLPKRYEGKVLSEAAKWKWWRRIVSFYILLAIYVVFEGVFILGFNQFHSLDKSGRVALFSICSFGLYSLWFSIHVRRSAYAVSLPQSPNPTK